LYEQWTSSLTKIIVFAVNCKSLLRHCAWRSAARRRYDRTAKVQFGKRSHLS